MCNRSRGNKTTKTSPIAGGGWGAAVFCCLVLMVGATNSGADVRIILRMDDSGFGRHVPAAKEGYLTDAEVTRRVVDLVVRNNAKLTIAVTPNIVSGTPNYNPPQPAYALLSSRADEVSALRSAIQTGCVEIALHGWTHQEMARHNGRPSEFGGRSFEEQSGWLAQGKEEVERSLGIPVTAFVPPFNNHDHATLLALQERNFQVISSGACDDDTVEGLRYVPCTTSLGQLRAVVDEAVRSGQPGLIVALFHGYEFVESGCATGWIRLDEFAALLGELSANQAVGFTTIQAEASRADAVHSVEGNRSYATYRDRVARIADIMRLFGSFGTKLETYLPTGGALYSVPRMRHIAFLMLCGEIVLNILIALVIAFSLFWVVRALARRSWARRLLVLAMAGGFLCLVALLLEGECGLVGQAGFGSRLVLVISCVSAFLAAGLIRAVTASRS